MIILTQAKNVTLCGTINWTGIFLKIAIFWLHLSQVVFVSPTSLLQAHCIRLVLYLFLKKVTYCNGTSTRRVSDCLVYGNLTVSCFDVQQLLVLIGKVTSQNLFLLKLLIHISKILKHHHLQPVWTGSNSSPLKSDVLLPFFYQLTDMHRSEAKWPKCWCRCRRRRWEFNVCIKQFARLAQIAKPCIFMCGSLNWK